VGPKEDIDVGVRRSSSELQAWKQRDPVRRLVDALLARQLLTRGEFETMSASIVEQVRAAATRAEAADYPLPGALLDRVFVKS
jgi:TPP-dependent pyruvate/acetoin dehydrogenase alpha subunit